MADPTDWAGTLYQMFQPQPAAPRGWPVGAVQPPVPTNVPLPPPRPRSAPQLNQSLDDAETLRRLMTPPPAPVRGMHGYGMEPWQADRWGDVAATRSPLVHPAPSVGAGLHRLPGLAPPPPARDPNLPLNYADPRFGGPDYAPLPRRGQSLRSGTYPNAPEWVQAPRPQRS
jgi:hypothetical protein